MHTKAGRFAVSELVPIVSRASGQPLFEGPPVTGFTDIEERAVGLTDVVLFSLGRALRDRGASSVAGKDFTSQAVLDGRLITGQNPESSAAIGAALLGMLQARQAA